MAHAAPDKTLIMEQTDTDSHTTKPLSADINTPVLDAEALTDQIINHPSSFSFPTLDIDGSLPDITTLTPNRSFSPAPPAALSTLGFKAKMAAKKDADLSDGYDMLDDVSVSDVSNDDDETASLLSERDDGMLTPDEEPESLVDVRQEFGFEVDMTDAPPLSGSAGSAAWPQKQTPAEDKLVDSSLSDSLETPRQSMIRPSRHVKPSPSASMYWDDARRILLVSERDVSDKELTDICLRIATFLGPKEQDLANSISRVVRFPPTPSGINPSSALFVRVGDVELLVEHCVGAKYRAPYYDHYGLEILDADKKHTSNYTVGPFNVGSFKIPELAVFYLNKPNNKTYPEWFDIAREAIGALSAPTITISDTPEGSELPELNKAFDKDLIVAKDIFFGEDKASIGSAATRLMVRNMVNPEPEANSTKSNLRAAAKAAMDSLTHFDSLGSIIFQLLFVTVTGLLISFLMGPRFFPAQVNPAAELALRTDALATALFKVVDPNLAVSLNITELLTPSSPLGISILSARSDSISRRDVFVGFGKEPDRRSYPVEQLTKVYKDDGHGIPFNMTNLIDGVYYISFMKEDAGDAVNLNMLVKNPALNFTTTLVYPRKAFQWKSYDGATKELTKILNKDIALASSNVRAMGSALGRWARPKAAATKEVALQLAWDSARDLQVYTQTAVSVLGKVGNHTAFALSKELAVVQKDLIAFSKDMHKSLQATAKSAKSLIPSKQPITDALALSHNRARRLKKAVEQGGKKDDKLPSTGKDIGHRLKNFFSADQSPPFKGCTSKKDCKWCATKKDCKSCRRNAKAAHTADNIASFLKESQTPTPDSPLSHLPLPDDILERARKESKKAMDEHYKLQKEIDAKLAKAKKAQDRIDTKAAKKAKKLREKVEREREREWEGRMRG